MSEILLQSLLGTRKNVQTHFIRVLLGCGTVADHSAHRGAETKSSFGQWQGCRSIQKVFLPKILILPGSGSGSMDNIHATVTVKVESYCVEVPIWADLFVASVIHLGLFCVFQLLSKGRDLRIQGSGSHN